MRTIPTPEEASEALYDEIGLVSGVEIHQQLLTERKLFCRCPAGRYSDEVHAEVLRHMRPTLSELGEYDGTALMEFKTRKEIIYQLNKETVCTYEMDDTPPFMIDEQALDIALELTMLLGCNLVSELHIARKQYLDGSIPTGFQRTTICGVNGAIRACGRTIHIRQLGLEEDACREVSDRGHVRVYRTDRLGMPLIEMVTEPEMRRPREVAEVVEGLRRLARSTGKVRTGLGATRQDVNVSVAGGTRCEIKGVPRIRMIPRLVHYEAMRQRCLLDLRDELLRRGLVAEEVQAPSTDVTGLLRRTEFLPLAAALEGGGVVRAVLLAGFGGTLSWPVGRYITFARELADRVRVVACLDGQPNLVHSDQAAETVTPRSWEAVRRRIGAGGDDAVVLVWGGERDVETAVGEIAIRAREAVEGIPSETRQAHWDGTTGFERVLPGPDRMYPDTDLPPKAIGEERIQRIAATMGVAPWVVAERLERGGMAPSAAWAATVGPWASPAEEALDAGLDAAVVETVVVHVLPGVARRIVGGGLTPAAVGALLEGIRRGALLVEAVPGVARAMIEGAPDLEAALDASGLRPLPSEEALALVERDLDAVDRGSLRRGGDAAARAVMGRVMPRVRGRVSGARVRARVDAWLAGDGAAAEEVRGG